MAPSADPSIPQPPPRPTFRRWSSAVAVAAALAVAIACNKSSTATSPTSTSIADPTSTETFRGTVATGGSSFYSFTVAANGTVNVTLAELLQAGQPSEATVNLSMGQPRGTGCSPSLTIEIGVSATAPHISGTYAPGVYCVRVGDPGSLESAAAFTVTLAHP
ncbi:MAG: hypothetical protein U0Q12_02180 [Vicinamibacterales bacterium]